MRKLFSLLCVAMFAITASAQITWNVKGGAGFATCYGDAEGLSSHFVGKIGVGIEQPFAPNWSVMPSLEVAWKGAKYDYIEDDYYKTSETLDMFYIQLPIVAAYRFNLSDSWNMTLKAGPYFAYAISGKMKGDYSMGDYYDSDDFDVFDDGDAKRFDLGLDFGVDFEYHRFVLGAEYELGLTEFSEGLKNAAAYVTIGYKF